MKIPFLDFSPMHTPLKSSIMKAFEEVYDANWFILGEKLKQFEKDFSAFQKIPFTLGVSNGLDALHLALRTLEIGVGDEVIVPSNTYIATALAVSYVGAKPVLVEPCADTFNIDPSAIEAAITSKTKAIIPVHLYGQACAMEDIMVLAKKYHLFVIEDNAQAIGAAWKGQLTATFGDINATSFYPGKNLGALGDAGAITTASEALAHRAMMLRNYGSEKKYEHEIQGFNMRMDEMQAAFLSLKLNELNRWTTERQQIAQWYQEVLGHIPELTIPYVHPEATHVYHLYVIRTKEREALQQYLSEKGVGTLIHYPIPPHLQKAYEDLGYQAGDFPIAEEMAKTCLSLPLWPGMTQEMVQYLGTTISNFFSKRS